MATYEERIAQALHELGIPLAVVAQLSLPLHPECAELDLVSIGLDASGREQRLQRKAASAWQKMRATAEQEGVGLEVVSAFRSFDYQRQIIARKLAAGISVEEIFRVNAPPGYSEHHTGRAVDVGTPGCPPVTAEFEHTAAFRWLARRSGDFGFRLSYPQDNPFGLIYEPWHWAWHEEAVTIGI